MKLILPLILVGTLASAPAIFAQTAPSDEFTPGPQPAHLQWGGLTENESPAGIGQPDSYLPADRGQAAPDAPNNKSKSSEWLIAPIPMYNPTIGAGAVLSVGYLFHPDPSDTVSPTSMVVGFAGGTTNGTWLAGGAARLNLFQDHLRLVFGAAHANVNYDFFGVGNAAADQNTAVPVTQTVDGFFGQSLFQALPHFYVGPEYLSATIGLASRTDRQLPALFPDISNAFSSKIAATGLVVQWDDTDSQFFPTQGSFVRLKSDFFEPAFGSDSSFQKYTFNAEHFWSLSDFQVLAFRGSFEAVTGDTPVYVLPTAGVNGDFRGYQAGKYRDKNLLYAQVEYRQRITDQWGYVLFTGTGEVIPSLSAMNMNDLLPSIGAGLRYTLSKENQVNFRLDVAGGRDGVVVYFGVGEAF